ncbi:MAG: hypothetical protein SFY69_00940 [Planctomycetota bacterium]|nr:hypothetical protein [Planctomycetota bacterium]
MNVDVGPELNRAFIVATYSVIVLLGWVYPMFGQLHARALVNACIAARACPSCRYEFGELPARDDGCVTCPECGAGWRVPGAPADRGQ